MVLGSVIRYENEVYVITGMVNYEKYGSCCFERDYYVMPLSEIEKREYVRPGEGRKIQVRQTSKLPFEEVTDVAPFHLFEETRYRVVRKQPKTIVIYE